MIESVKASQPSPHVFFIFDLQATSIPPFLPVSFWLKPGTSSFILYLSLAVTKFHHSPSFVYPPCLVGGQPEKARSTYFIVIFSLIIRHLATRFICDVQQLVSKGEAPAAAQLPSFVLPPRKPTAKQSCHFTILSRPSFLSWNRDPTATERPAVLKYAAAVNTRSGMREKKDVRQNHHCSNTGTPCYLKNQPPSMNFF